MAPAQALSSINDEGKSDVAVKSENKDYADTKDASGIIRADNGKDATMHAGSSKDLMVEDIQGERKLDNIVKSENMELLDSEDDESGLMCANNCQDNVFNAGSSTGLKKVNYVMDDEIDIINWTDNGDVKIMKDEDSDATEYSSSFAETFSGSESELKLERGDMEVDSPFVPSNGDPAVMDDRRRIFKKKKVSAQWRKFIRPLTWRCQWLEVRIKELLSQASLYDKELAAYKHEKELLAKMIELDSSVSRTVPFMPFTSRHNWKSAMKRRKRKRNEDKVDISSYMSNHVVFSYYENKRIDTDGHSVGDDCGDLAEDSMKGNDDNEWLLGSKGNDIPLEQILLNIEAVQSRVMKLKSHLNSYLCINAIELSSPHNLFLGDPPAGYAQNISDSARNNGDAMLTGLHGTSPYHVSEYEIDDMDIPNSAASSYGDAADIDIVESTVGLLSDITMDQHQNGELCRDSEEDVLIDNQVAEEEYHNFEKVTHATQKLQGIVKTENEAHSGDESISPEVSVPEPSLAEENVCMPRQAVLKSCYTGKKRGRKPKKKRRGGSVSLPGPSRSEKAHGSGPSRSERLQNAGSSKSEKLQAFIPLRSERLQKRRLLASKKG